MKRLFHAQRHSHFNPIFWSPNVQELKRRRNGLKAWPLVAIAVMQALLLGAHWFIYRTWIAFWPPLSPLSGALLREVVLLLAFSFMIAALLGFKHANWAVILLYRFAAVWLGFLNFIFWAACLCWVADFTLALLGLTANKSLLATVFFGMAVVAGIYGLVNARFIRIHRIPVQLAGLPEIWRGRTALVISDLHLGHINGSAFSRRIAALATRLKPDIIFIPGDLFDGGKANVAALVEPFRQLAPPLGSYFATGNHDEFGDTALYAESLARVGIRVLANEKVTVDGLDIIGVNDGDSGNPIRLRAILESLSPVPGRASILLNHVPNRLPIVEQAGISLQLSGHTHNGQIFPYKWFTHRIFGDFTYGLHRLGRLQVLTSCGVGTWGPPMRVGTSPEVVVLTLS
jgi:predicted MPP superfamily phosphohydrolase